MPLHYRSQNYAFIWNLMTLTLSELRVWPGSAFNSKLHRGFTNRVIDCTFMVILVRLTLLCFACSSTCKTERRRRHSWRQKT